MMDASLPSRIALLGDIHGNATAFASALNAIRDAGIRRVVFLGDLLTYGCAPRECVTLAQQMVEEFDTTMLAGNHEPFYFDGQAGDDARFCGKRSVIAESVRWTLDQIRDVDYVSAFDWRTELELAHIYVHHANPYRDGTWAYVNTEADEAYAGAALAESPWRVGIFGHTHRARLTQFNPHAPMRFGVQRHEGSVSLQSPFVWLLNAGSIGQPRGMGATWLELDVVANTATHHDVSYDVAAHVRQIEASGLSDDTSEQLIRFFGAY